MFKVGDRVRLLRMDDDPDPVPVGTEGIVDYVKHVDFFTPSFWQVGVKWDNGRTLMLSIPPDAAARVSKASDN